MTRTKIILVNTLAQGVTKIITVGIGIITRKLLAVYLGPAGIGEYLFVLTFVAIFGSIADMGTVLITVRDAAKDKLKAPSLLGGVFWLRLILSSIATFIAAFIMWILPSSNITESLRLLTIFGSLLIIVFSMKASLGIVFQVFLKMEQWVVPEIISSIVTLILIIVSIYSQGSLFQIVGSVMVANVIATITAFLLTQKIIRINFQLNKNEIISIFKNALPMGGVLIVFSIYNKSDMLLLQTIKGSQAVGIYGVAYSVYDVLVLGAAYFMNTVLPLLSETYNQKGNNKEIAHSIYQKSFATLFCLAIIMAFLTEILAPFIISVIATPEFINSVFILRILTIGTFIAYFNHLTGYTLVVLNHQRAYFAITIIALGINVIGNLILIPLFFEKGSAIMTVITEGVVFILTSVLIYKIQGWLPDLRAIPKTVLDVLKNRGAVFYGKQD